MKVPHFFLRLESGWAPVADAAHPLRLRMPNNTWQVFADGGGDPLKLRMPDGTWKIIATAGRGNLISGHVYLANGHPAANKLVLSSGSFATTDATGFYALEDLADGVHEVRAYASDFQYTSASVTLAPDHRLVTLDLHLPSGFTNVTVQFNGRAGWFASYGTGDNTFTTGFSVPALSGSSVNMNDFFSEGTQSTHSVSWLPLPINAMREWAETQVTGFDNPVLQRIDVNFTISGNSFVSDTTDIPYSGTGTIVYQGPAATDHTEELVWNPVPSDFELNVLPVIRDRAFARETGINVWTGNLADAFTLPIITTYTLPASYPAESAVFHAYTSEAPLPAAHHQINNSLSINISTDFVFSYG